MKAITNLDTTINRHSSIVHYYAQWADNASGNFSANQPWMLAAIRNYSSVGVTGATPLITWEPWGPPYSVSNNQFPLKGIAAGNFDPYIDSWAAGLKTYGGPVMLDWGHEMDGNWYPWGTGVNGNTAADYIAAFRHVHDRFTAAGVTNVQFVWNVNVWSPGMGTDSRSLYPGDAYVDWMAIDVYNWGANGGGWASLAYGLNLGQYANIASLNATKPIMLAEWASAEPVPADPPGVTKGQWTIDASVALGTQFPRIQAVVWFSSTGSTFALDSSANSLAGAKTAFGGCAAPPPTPTPSPTPTPTPSPSPSPAPTVESLSGYTTTGAATASWGPNRLDVFARGWDNQLYHKWWNGTAWTGWEALGGNLTSDPTAVSWGANRMDVFARCTNNVLCHKWWTTSGWSGWQTLGGNLASGPEVASWGPNRLDVFARCSTSSLCHRAFNGSSWASWETLAGPITSDPVAVSSGPNRIDVFAKGTDNGLYQKSWTGSAWTGWQPLGGALGSGPAAASPGAGLLDVFVIGTDGALYQRSWTGSSWTPWQSLGGTWSTNDPAAVSRTAGHVDVLVIGTDNAVWHESI